MVPESRWRSILKRSAICNEYDVQQKVVGEIECCDETDQLWGYANNVKVRWLQYECWIVVHAIKNTLAATLLSFSVWLQKAESYTFSYHRCSDMWCKWRLFVSLLATNNIFERTRHDWICSFEVRYTAWFLDDTWTSNILYHWNLRIVLCLDCTQLWLIECRWYGQLDIRQM